MFFEEINLSNNTNITEPQLVEMLKKGERKGLEILYERYSRALYGITLKILHKEELAQDVLQEAFVKIWKNIGSYNSQKGTLFTWMLNITRNLAIDKLRSKAYKNSQKNQAIDISVSKINTHSKINIDTIGLKEIVAKLKPQQKELIDLMYFKGYTQVEISEELEIPLGTVKTRLRAAIMALRLMI